MEINDTRIIAEKLYKDIELNGIEAIKKLFSEGKTLSEKLQTNPSEEYIKRILIFQMDIGKIIFHKPYKPISECEKEAKKIREQINSDGTLKFDENVISSLFGNSLKINSNNDYKEWEKFAYSGKCYTIYEEEEFKYNYKNEKNLVKKFIKSFRYKKMMKNDEIEDAYGKKIREMIKKEFSKNPEKIFIAYENVKQQLETGLSEYQSIKEIENISKMTLKPFISTKTQKPINIKETCELVRKEAKNKIGTTEINEEYRQELVTLGKKKLSFEHITEDVEELQKQYENIYNTEQSTEEYIKSITKIYADFMFIQPYKDGNKRTALCLLNSMLISKDILPPAVSLANDEKMIKAYNKARNEDYTMLQKLVVDKYNEMKKSETDSTEIGNKQCNKTFDYAL